ncbi:MAG: hypothetical protein Q9223_004114 [Gallowayella weberi]
MAPRKGSRAPGAPRAGGSHVRTGCLTCKARHVKCDEEKPECSKCKSTGRRCDGYGLSKDVHLLLTTAEKQSRAIADQPHIKTAYTRLTPVAFTLDGWDGTMDELRGFDYFRRQTSQDLAYSLNASLQEIVLQNSHHHDAIKHGAIALGSLGETIRINSSSLSSNTFPPAFVQHRFARSQYYKAIRILQRNISRDERGAVEIALISCFLFIVFEFLQGNDQSARAHLRSGLAILRKQYFSQAGSTSVTKEYLKLNSTQSGIARIFHTLDTQATMWLDLKVRSFQDESYSPIVYGRSASRHIAPTPFDSLDEACDDLVNLINRVYNFRCYTSKHDRAPSTDDVPHAIYAERDALLDELDVHRHRLSSFLARQIDAENPEDPHHVTILRINRKVTSLMLATYLEPHEERFYARCVSHFWQIMYLATFILRQSPEMPRRVVQIVHAKNQAKDAPYGRRLFSFAGLIQPLYFTAIKCREKATAQKAVDLLEMEPWEEGPWDSAAMAKIARRKMEELEAKGWYNLYNNHSSVEHTRKKRESSTELSVEWPLATDPFIAYLLAETMQRCCRHRSFLTCDGGANCRYSALDFIHPKTLMQPAPSGDVA